MSVIMNGHTNTSERTVRYVFPTWALNFSDYCVFYRFSMWESYAYFCNEFTRVSMAVQGTFEVW